jgi:nucleoside-diphosphate-sugar epimerase
VQFRLQALVLAVLLTVAWTVIGFGLATLQSLYPGTGVATGYPPERPAVGEIGECRRAGPIGVNGFGYWHLEDAAAATVAALEKGRAAQACNIVDDEPVRWADYLDTLAAELGVRRPWRVPSWMLRPIPYLHTILTTSMRVSNAKARRELGWAPAVSTYREGIPLVARASR